MFLHTSLFCLFSSLSLQYYVFLLLQIYFLKLGSHCQKILELFYYQEKKLGDIVNALGYDNKDVVKSQKSRCIKQLRKLIETNHG